MGGGILQGRCRQTTAREPSAAHHLLSKTNFYWNRAMPICLYKVYSCFHTMMSEMVVATEIIQPSKPKVFTIFYFL